MSLYKQPGSSVWSTRFKINGESVRRSTGQYDRQAAQRFEDELKAELWKRPVALKGKTWGNAVLAWVKAETRSDSDIQSLAKLGLYLADQPLATLTPETIAKALDKFCKTAGTYNRYCARIAAILKLAGAEIKLTPKRDTTAKTRDWLTHEQWAKLKAELPLHMRHMATFAVATGLRQANVLGLTWNRVDLDRKLVWVEGQDMKSKKAIGVPLSIEAINVLKTVQGQHAEFCFTYRGKPVKEIKTAFQAAAIRAGAGRSLDGRYIGFTWHGLRHTWATWHIQNGTPIEVLQRLGGWSDLRMVTVYAHHSPGFLAQYADNTMSP